MKSLFLIFLTFLCVHANSQLPFLKKIDVLPKTSKYPMNDSLVVSSQIDKMPILKLECRSKTHAINLKSTDKMTILFYKKKEENLDK